MALYQSIEISSSKDIYYLLTSKKNPSSSQLPSVHKNNEINDAWSNINANFTYYAHSSIIASKGTHSTRESMSINKAWIDMYSQNIDNSMNQTSKKNSQGGVHTSQSREEEVLNQQLKRQKIEWTEAFYDLTHSLLYESSTNKTTIGSSSPSPYSFYVLGDDLFVSAYITKLSSSLNPLCIITGANRDMFHRLIAYGANPKYLRIQPNDSISHTNTYRSMSIGISITCIGHFQVLAAATCIAESIAPPLRTMKHYLHTPNLICLKPFLHCSIRTLQWQDLSVNRYSEDPSTLRRFIYRANGIVLPNVIEAFSSSIPLLSMKLSSDRQDHPLYVPVYLRDSSLSAVSSLPPSNDVPIVSMNGGNVPAPSKKLKSGFRLVAVAPKNQSQNTFTNDQVVGDSSSINGEMDDSFRLTCNVVDTTIMFAFADEVLRFMSNMQIREHAAAVDDDEQTMEEISDNGDLILGRLLTAVGVQSGVERRVYEDLPVVELKKDLAEEDGALVLLKE